MPTLCVLMQIGLLLVTAFLAGRLYEKLKK
jgi:hypothetical protein